MDDFKLIEDQLNYEMFLAEQTMNMEFHRLERQKCLFTESADIIALNEAMSDVIKKYVAKVTQSIQKAWNNFKLKIDEFAINKVLTPENNKLIEDKGYSGMIIKEGFEYPELNAWNELNTNVTVGKNILNAGNYQQYKPYLESAEKFLQQYYPITVEGNKKPIEVFNEKCFTKAGKNKVVKSDVMIQYRDFLIKYVESVNLIQQDIDAINEVNQNISDMEKAIGESVIFEDGENNQPQQTQTNVPTQQKADNKNDNGFRNADGSTSNKNGSEDRKNIINYYKAMTSILTAKMRTCNKIGSNSMMLISNYIKLQGGSVLGSKKKTEEKK